MHNLSLRTAILKRSSLKIAVGEMHSPVCQARENGGIRTERDIDCNAVSNRAPRGTPRGIQDCLQPCGSRAQTITCDTQGAHYQTSFARVGSPTKTFHEGENTVLIDETNGGVGPAAKGGGNIQNLTTLTNQRCGT